MSGAERAYAAQKAHRVEMSEGRWVCTQDDWAGPGGDSNIRVLEGFERHVVEVILESSGALAVVEAAAALASTPPGGMRMVEAVNAVNAAVGDWEAL